MPSGEVLSAAPDIGQKALRAGIPWSQPPRSIRLRLGCFDSILDAISHS